MDNHGYQGFSYWQLRHHSCWHQLAALAITSSDRLGSCTPCDTFRYEQHRAMPPSMEWITLITRRQHAQPEASALSCLQPPRCHGRPPCSARNPPLQRMHEGRRRRICRQDKLPLSHTVQRPLPAAHLLWMQPKLLQNALRNSSTTSEANSDKDGPSWYRGGQVLKVLPDLLELSGILAPKPHFVTSRTHGPLSKHNLRQCLLPSRWQQTWTWVCCSKSRADPSWQVQPAPVKSSSKNRPKAPGSHQVVVASARSQILLRSHWVSRFTRQFHQPRATHILNYGPLTTSEWAKSLSEAAFLLKGWHMRALWRFKLEAPLQMPSLLWLSSSGVVKQSTLDLLSMESRKGRWGSRANGTHRATDGQSRTVRLVQSLAWSTSECSTAQLSLLTVTGGRQRLQSSKMKHSEHGLWQFM